MDIDLDDPRIRRHLQILQATVGRRRIAFDPHGQGQGGRRVFDRRDQLEVILQSLQGRHEQVQPAVARLDTDRRPHHVGSRLAASRRCGRLGRGQRQLRGRRRRRRGRAATGVLRLERGWAGTDGWRRRQGLPKVDGLVVRQRFQRPALIRIDRQGLTRRLRVGLVDLRRVFRGAPGNGIQRQPESQRRVAGNQEQAFAAQEPASALPMRPAGARARPDRQRITDDTLQPSLEDSRQPRPFLGVVQSRFQRIDIHRQPPLSPQIIPGVFISRQNELAAHAQPLRQSADKRLRFRSSKAIVPIIVGDQVRLAPNRLPVLAPIAAQCPPRQRLAGIPLALAEMQQRPPGKPSSQAAEQSARQFPLARAQRGHIPLGTVHVVDRHEGRLAAHGQPHVTALQDLVHPAAQGVDFRPLVVRVGLGDPRVFVNPADGHLVVKCRLAGVHASGHRGGRGRVGGRRQRQVAFACQQTRGGIESHPAGAGQVYLGPSMEVGEVVVGPGRPLQRLDVGAQLDQITRHKTGRQAQIPQELDEQPGGIPARPAAQLERLFAGLDPGFQADDVAHRLVHIPIQIDQKVDGARHAPRDAVNERLQPWTDRQGLQVRPQFFAQPIRIAEWVLNRVALQEEVERVDRRQFGHYVHLQLKELRRPGEDQAGQEVAVRILLPVEEMLLRQDLQRIGRHRRAAVRRGPQADNLRRQRHGAIVAIGGPVMKSDTDAHNSLLGWIRRQAAVGERKETQAVDCRWAAPSLDGARSATGCRAKKVSKMAAPTAFNLTWNASMNSCSPPPMISRIEA